MKQMRVVAINGSPRKQGNTHILINRVLDVLKTAGIETEIIKLGGENVRGCLACNECWKNKNQKCTIDSDVIHICLEKMLKADGIILGSPTYFANVTTEIKALIDKAGAVGCANSNKFKCKVGAAVVGKYGLVIKKAECIKSRRQKARLPVLFLSTSLSSNRQYLGEHFTSYVTHRNTGYSMQSQQRS